MYVDTIDFVNKYSNIPIEVKRLIFECVLAKIEKEANNSIREEIGCDMKVDNLIVGGENDGENV